MLCPKCGKEMPNDSQFCMECGAKLTAPDENKKAPKIELSSKAETLKEGFGRIDPTKFVDGVAIVAGTCWTLLTTGWRKLKRWLYAKLSDMEPDGEPTVQDIWVALRECFRQMPKRTRRFAYAGTAVALVLVVCLVGAVVSAAVGGSGGSGGSGSGGGTFQSEIKLTCTTCVGSGSCNNCGGSGKEYYYASGGGTISSGCYYCSGSGNCRACGGSGKR